MLTILLLSLLLTECIELSVAWLWGLRGRDLGLCVLCNLMTNPPVVLFSMLMASPWCTFLLEWTALLTEYWCYRYRGNHVRMPFLLSFSANCISYTIGCMI